MIRAYSPIEHYEIFSYFSTLHKWPILEESLLPPIGFVSYLNDLPACFSFVYETVGSKWAILEWLMVNPDLEKVSRSLVIEECIEAAKQHAKNKGLVLFTSCKSAKLNQRYIDAGFQKTDEGMTNFVYRG